MNKAWHTILPPPAHSRRATHFLKPLPIAALAALLAAPAAWAAIQGATETPPASGIWIGNSPYQVTIDSDATSVTGRQETLGSDATGAIVTMTAGTVTDYVGGGSTHQSNATGNKVFIHDGTADYVYGGDANEGNATENAVTITGGTVNGAFGGSALKGNATGNTVTISGGTVDSDVFGGSADQGNATGNTVTITGGTVKLDVLGGSAYEGYATGNTVTLAGGAVTGAVYGGSCYHSSGTCDDITGNTLAVLAKGMTVGGDVFNFDTLNFDLATVGANDTVLEVAGGADFSKVTSANFSFNLADGAALKPGDKIYLIKADTLDIPSLPTSVTVCGHDFVLHADANTLTATVKGATPAPYSGGDSSSPTMGELGLLLSGIALAGAAAPALRRREKRSKKG